jgi:hypothetical protein
MPYDSSKAAEFRTILKTLSEEAFLSSDKALDLVHADRRKQHGGAALAPLDLSRSAIDRFKSGGRIKSNGGLRELWRVLESHPDYAYAFSKPATVPMTVSPEEAMASALTRYFSESSESKPLYNVGKVRRRLAGRYILYRPAWRLGVPPQMFMTSFIEIVDTDIAHCVFYEQDFPEDDKYGAYYQKDAGFIFTFGNSIYVLAKQIGEGTTVRLMVANTVERTEGKENRKWVEYFFGLMYTASYLRLYPSVKFFCQRIRANENAKSEYMLLENIPNAAAIAYLGGTVSNMGTL